MSKSPRRPYTASPPIALLLLALVVTSCSGPPVFLRRPAAPLVWPEPPEEPRVGYVMAYHGSADVERHPGFWAALGELVAGAPEHELLSPNGLALDGAGRLWVADPGQSAVHRIDLQSGEHAVFAGTDAEPMATPVDVAPGPDGAVFVSDSTRARILVLDRDGGIVRAFGDADHLGRPTGIAWDDARQRLLVVDTTGCRLLALAADGTLLQEVGSRGDGPGLFNYPTHLAVAADGRVFVTDSMNFRVQVFGPDLAVRSSFGSVGRGPGTFAAPKGVAVDSQGHVYVVDGMFDNVQIFRDDGELLLAVGEHGGALGQLALPRGIWIAEDDRIFLADGGNSRVQILQFLRR